MGTTEQDRIDQLTRRRFLLLTAAAAASQATGLGLGSPADAVAAPGGSGNGQTVVVLGGGLAGLCCRRTSFATRGTRSLAVLEAQQRTGGRVQTVRSRASSTGSTPSSARHGSPARTPSHSATRVSSACRGRVHERRRPVLAEGPGAVRSYRRHGVARRRPAGPPRARPTLGADAISWNMTAATISSTPVPGYSATRTPPMAVDNALAANLIPVSTASTAANSGASDDAFLLNRAINGSEIYSDGALYWLMADIVDATWSQTFAITGGNDRLPPAFTSRARCARQAAAVTAIRHRPRARRCRCRSSQKGPHSTVDADFVVCAPAILDSARASISRRNLRGQDGAFRTFATCRSDGTSCRPDRGSGTSRGIGGLKIARTDSRHRPPLAQHRRPGPAPPSMSARTCKTRPASTMPPRARNFAQRDRDT